MNANDREVISGLTKQIELLQEQIKSMNEVMAKMLEKDNPKVETEEDRRNKLIEETRSHTEELNRKLEQRERNHNIAYKAKKLGEVVNNFGEHPFIIKGGEIKSVNQYFNKKKAELQSDLKKKTGKDWSNRLEKLTNKRYEKIKYLMHCISKQLVDYCVLHNVDTLVIGLNKKWKQENGGKQNFTYIPYDLSINHVKSKCEQNGIKCIETEEGYTSGTSFLDNEEPIKENYDKKRRVYRGLFVSKSGKTINADVNGAYQIMKKVVPDAFSEGIEGVGLHPVRFSIS